MMRKMIILLAVLLPIFVTMAHDDHNQPPIIAQRDNRWYTVSPVDGVASVLVEPPADEKLLALQEGNLSPDGQWLAYETFNYDNPPKVSHYKLFLMNLATREVEQIIPIGGVFDRPLPATQVYQLLLPTWSYDGTRLYYVRTEVEARNSSITAAAQLAYYDLEKGEHHLAGRLDPAKVIDELSAVPNGMILRTVQEGGGMVYMTLYAPNNAITKASEFDSIDPTPMIFEGEMYYAFVGKNTIDTLFNTTTGKTVKVDKPYFPAFRSRVAGDESLRFFHMFDNGSSWNVYSSDHANLLQTLRPKMGARLAISPDGHAVAYILYSKPGEGMIQVMDSTGISHELPFKAELIVWGALEGEAFLVNK